MMRSFRFTPIFADFALVAAILGAPALATEEALETVPAEAIAVTQPADPTQDAEKVRVAQAWQEVVSKVGATQTTTATTR